MHHLVYKMFWISGPPLSIPYDFKAPRVCLHILAFLVSSWCGWGAITKAGELIQQKPGVANYWFLDFMTSIVYNYFRIQQYMLEGKVIWSTVYGDQLQTDWGNWTGKATLGLNDSVGRGRRWVWSSILSATIQTLDTLYNTTVCPSLTRVTSLNANKHFLTVSLFGKHLRCPEADDCAGLNEKLTLTFMSCSDLPRWKALSDIQHCSPLQHYSNSCSLRPAINNADNVICCWLSVHLGIWHLLPHLGCLSVCLSLYQSALHNKLSEYYYMHKQYIYIIITLA